jgi:predicted dehydrogenase
MTKCLRVGIAGYGIVGKRRRVCVDKNRHMQLVAVCDQTFAGDGVFDDGVNFFSDYRNLLSFEFDVVCGGTACYIRLGSIWKC